MVKLLSVVSIFYHKNFFASLTTILTHRGICKDQAVVDKTLLRKYLIR